jgi:RimJ/RimL family protein N-acetyltransferase
MRTPHWPMYDLEVRTPRVTLRYPDDDIVIALADLAAQGIHDPAYMPFTVPWTDAPSPERERGAMQHYWLNRATWQPHDWNLAFAVEVDGELVGAQGAFAKDFGSLREATTGSWLGQRFQGQGIGTEMRAAILHFLFEGLGATYACSGAFEDNAPSLTVTRKLGYEESGRRRALRRGQPAWLVDYRLPRERWTAQRRDDIELAGVEPCLPLFGVT